MYPESAGLSIDYSQESQYEEEGHFYLGRETLILASELSLRNSLIVQSPLCIAQVLDKLLETHAVLRLNKRDRLRWALRTRCCYRVLARAVAVEPTTTGGTQERRQFQER